MNLCGISWIPYYFLKIFILPFQAVILSIPSFSCISSASSEFTIASLVSFLEEQSLRSFWATKGIARLNSSQLCCNQTSSFWWKRQHFINCPAWAILRRDKSQPLYFGCKVKEIPRKTYGSLQYVPLQQIRFCRSMSVDHWCWIIAAEASLIYKEGCWLFHWFGVHLHMQMFHV